MIDRSNDEPVTNIKTFLLADPSPQGRMETERWFVAFVNFLQDNGLTARKLLKKGQTPDESFEIWESDLTEEGVAVVDKAFDRWLGALDRGKAPDDVSILEKALAKIRKF
ncbi:hypothetical protein LOC68_05355 [Blastopirellula sp. JC732]|uniref:Uncharacterized protein n=1 Tax=Blastopirellula sediminis TaxID=2894196 RepID=A0A9X1MLQ3_9BACT|nr:hypothetical protein [Blastopirellula sediminis]MCC9609409.1 hypothetical protein [Blastopirellula sediminis]MCC9627814.1 hypothetical protein [Blastopirellula sediminis]